MQYTHIPHGSELVNALYHTKSEMLVTAARNIASRDDVTVEEVERIRDLIDLDLYHLLDALDREVRRDEAVDWRATNDRHV